MLATVANWFDNINWGAVGGICGALGIIGGLAKWVVGEVRQNRTVITTVKDKVTTPNTVPGTIGQTVADISVEQAQHNATDEQRFANIWSELGKPEPDR